VSQTQNTQTEANEVKHVVKNADICLIFTLSPAVKLFVSSEVLSRSSPIFEKLVRPTSDNRDPVRTFNIPDVYFEPMTDLCVLLHKGCKLHVAPDVDAACAVMDLAVAAEAYNVVGILKSETSPAMFHALEQTRSKFSGNRVEDEKASGLAFIADAMLAAAAYVLEQEEMFTLYTKRMVMDHCVHSSELSVLCKVDYFKMVPTFAFREYYGVLYCGSIS
jgi:hypothetical protein